MSHPEQLRFFYELGLANERIVDNSRVLEIGSYDVNGSLRSFFTRAGEYVGVDLVSGPGVDLVSYGHDVTGPDGSFDVALSAECFEHDPRWSDTLTNMIRLTRAGGLVAFSCASQGRVEHGTTRTNPRNSPGTQSRKLDYYRNLEVRDFLARIDMEALFSLYKFWYIPSSCDLYFAGVRKGASSDSTVARLPSEDSVNAIKNMMSGPRLIARIPLRIVGAVASESIYQRFAIPYYRLLNPFESRFLISKDDKQPVRS
jgi:SAM-dependent methyltransferase